MSGRLASGGRVLPSRLRAAAVSARAAVLAGVAAATLALAPAPAGAQDVDNGRLVYDRWCAECHGAEGAGDGPAADHMLPRPRDFTAARYQIRTTGSGELPTTEDILRVVEDGMPGTAMPGWPELNSAQRRDVVAYLKTFSPFFEGPSPERLDLGADPGGGGDALEVGRDVYVRLECDRCHGERGRGDGSSAPTLEDWRDLPVRAADLTQRWNFNGGSSVEAIHTRILTGLDGTPMPAALDALRSDVVTEEEVWQLAHYVAALGPAERPGGDDVVLVRLREEGVPTAPGDSAWDEAPVVYFPLSGQVIEPPRNFSPTVDGVRVQAFHDGSELALRLSWNDPSRSPDPAWAEWQARMAEALYVDEAEIPAEPLPDAVAVQFPPEPGAGRRPYFLMGGGNAPVVLWRWDADEGVTEARARGMDQLEPLPEAAVGGSASWEAGEWSLVLRRPLEVAEGPGPVFREGVPVPIAFFVWDGSSAETGKRGAISSWYYLQLEEPRSNAVFLAPLLAVLLTGGLGLVAVRRARSTERRRTAGSAASAEVVG